eukprot:1192782-Prorocentrum_minimum.AAC.4
MACKSRVVNFVSDGRGLAGAEGAGERHRRCGGGGGGGLPAGSGHAGGGVHPGPVPCGDQLAAHGDGLEGAGAGRRHRARAGAAIIM